MTQRPLMSGELPAPDVVAFIRYCHRRRGASWPELYDEMCGVAARREFNGWDHAELAAREGLIGLAINDGTPLMPPPGGTTRVVGNGPALTAVILLLTEMI